VSLAGQIAEALHARRRPARYSHAADDDNAVDYATEVCGSAEECSAWINWLFIRTRNHLQLGHIWLAVEFLAEELMKRKTIRSADARDIIRGAFASYGASRRADRPKQADVVVSHRTD
jgi:hypothetical protein